ncbi:actin-binding protein WASF1 [Oryctolagus cuniculus]|uniref:actin-binding protein WASF1 n=1 Tax=Oryctolagus cuniculus TaxID=9986 RepID=UPI00039042EF|nr:actin-binding protein WASF1 [Oryctolagus cuniculus]
MSVNEEKDEECPDEQTMPREIRDEFVYVIQMSLSGIYRQVSDLSKYAENILGELSKKMDMVAFKLKSLQENVIQLTDVITHKAPKEDLSLLVRKSRNTFQGTMAQIQQIPSSESPPVKMCEVHHASVQTAHLTMPAPYSQDIMEDLKISSDASFSSRPSFSELCKEKMVPESKPKRGKFKQKKKHLDHLNKPQNVCQSQLMEDNTSMGPNPAVCGETSHSTMDQSPLSTFPFSKIRTLLSTAVGKVLSNPANLSMHGAGDVKTSPAYISYGTGIGEDLQPQPRNHLKAEVFVSPTAPPSPPPLPPNWLTMLRASKRASLPPITHSQIQLPTPVLRTTTAISLPNCLQITPDSSLPFISTKEFSTSVPKFLQYGEQTPDGLLPHYEDQGIPTSLPFYPIISPSNQSGATITDPADPALVVQSSGSSIFQSVKSSFAQSPRTLVEKSPGSSIPSKPRSSLLPPPNNLVPPTSRSSISPLPRYSTTMSDHSISVSVSSSPQTLVTLNSLWENSFTHSPKPLFTPLAKCLASLSSSSPVAKSTRYLTPSQSGSSSVKSTKSSTPQSSLSFVQSRLSISSPRALSVPQSSIAPVYPVMRPSSPPPLPKISKSRKTLMEEIRKGVVLHKTKGYCSSKAKKNPSIEASTILSRRKAMGYSSGKSDSEVDGVDEK